MATELLPVTQQGLIDVLESLGLSALDDIIRQVLQYDEETDTYYMVSDTLDSLSEDVKGIRETVQNMDGAAARPFLETPLSEYTVTEGLLATILFVMFVQAVGRLIKGAFPWL